MMEKLWQIAISIGGLAAISAFVLWSLYKDWLELPIFSKLSSNHTFILMLLFISLTFISSLVMLIIYIRTNSSSIDSTDKNIISNFPPDKIDYIRRKYLLLGYTLQVYMAMFLDNEVMKNNLQLIVSLEKQISQLINLVNLDFVAPNASKNYNRDDAISQVSTIDSDIKIKLEVIDMSYKAYYMNGRWLGLCLASVATLKIPGLEMEKVENLLKILCERYLENEKYSDYFHVSQYVKDELKQIYNRVYKLYKKREVNELDYYEISNKILALLGKLD